MAQIEKTIIIQNIFEHSSITNLKTKQLALYVYMYNRRLA